MSTAEERAALRAALAEVKAEIAQAEGALQAATSVDDVARINARLVTLRAKKTNLELRLNNVTAALASSASTAAAASSHETLHTGGNTTTDNLIAELGGNNTTPDEVFDDIEDEESDNTTND